MAPDGGVVVAVMSRLRAPLVVFLFAAVALQGPTISAGTFTIFIEGDADFASQASSNGWPGDGSASDPYVISGYAFDVSHGTFQQIPLLQIKDTTVHFIVRNNTFTSTDTYVVGIDLINAPNAVITNNTFTDIYRGVEADRSPNIQIRGNTYENDRHSWAKAFVVLDGTDNASLDANFIRGADGIDVQDGLEAGPDGYAVRVRDNVIRLPGYGTGILVRAVDSHIAGNDVRFGEYGMSISGSTTASNIIENNYVANMTELGIAAGGATVRYNQVINIEGPGISARAPVIENNTVSNCHRGITFSDGLFGSAGTTIRYNNVADCWTGVEVSNGASVVHDNTITGVWLTGVSVYTNQPGTVIRDNAISGGRSGISVLREGVTVQGNVLQGDGTWNSYLPHAGVLAGFKTNIVVLDNSIAGHQIGVIVRKADNSLVRGNTISDGERGIQVDGIRNTVEENAITQTQLGLEILQDRNDVARNHVVGNDVGIEVRGYSNNIVDNWFENAVNTLRLTEGNQWSLLTPEAGPNIRGGAQVGGNYWSDHPAPLDANGDGFHDVPYSVVGIYDDEVDDTLPSPSSPTYSITRLLDRALGLTPDALYPSIGVGAGFDRYPLV